MAVSYQIYPKDTTKGRSFGFIVIKSSKVVIGVEAPLITFLSGIGGKGNGTQSELEALYNGEVPSQLKEGIEKYGFVCIAVQSNSSYSMGEQKFGRDWALANLPVDKTRKYLTGPSWGGGGTAGQPLISAEDAKLFDAIAPIAMTWQNMGTNQVKAKYITDANLAVWAFHNLRDNNAGTPPSATVAYIDAINALNPKIKATKTMFWQPFDNHGGWGEAYNADKIPIDPQSQGMINPACNLYEWMLMNNSTTRVAVPTKGVITPPIEPPATTIKAITSYMITGNKIALIGRNSTGYNIGYDGTWQVISGPATSKQVFPLGSSYIDANGFLPVPGTYVFRFSLKGALPVDVTVQHVDSTPIPTPKQPKTFDFGTKQLNFEDGTKEPVTSIKIITESGTPYGF